MRSSSLLCLFLLLACDRAEQPYRHYSAQSEAVAAGEARRGWLPHWVPASATDLHIQGDLDTNRTWLRFTLSPEARGRLQSGLMPFPASDLREVRWRRPAASSEWWPRGLIQKTPADDLALNADLFATQDGQFIVAFDRTGDHVFAWSAAP